MASDPRAAIRRNRCLARLAALSIAAAATAQPPATPTDWHKEVERACTHARYGLRLAASKKVAAAGDEAVPAIKVFQAAKGRDAIPVALVEAIAELNGTGKDTVLLLHGWATDREFFWRAQALRGLARRQLPVHAELFRQGIDDPAWLFRTYARLGLAVHGEPLPKEVSAGLRDADPRAATKLGALLLARGEANGFGVLVGSLGDERTFLGDPWGQRRATEALAALKQWAGIDLGWQADKPLADNAAAVARLLALAKERLGAEFPAPAPIRDPAIEFDGGIEILSCREGDLFVRWAQGRKLHWGLGGDDAIDLPAAAADALTAQRRALVLPPHLGVVICDRMRLRWREPEYHGTVAPGMLPGPVAAWLKEIAATLDENGHAGHADRLRRHLPQFEGR